MIDDLISLRLQLARDRQMDDVSLRRRDRAIGRTITARSAHRRLLAWLAQLQDLQITKTGSRAKTALRLGLVMMFLIGLVLGWAAASVTLNYDGTVPINIAKVWMVLIASQLLLLWGFLMLAIPQPLAARIPGVQAIQQLLTCFSPGRVVPWFVRKLPAATHESLGSLLPNANTTRRSDQSVYKWSALHASQIFAVGFNLGLLLGCLFLVSFTDLAFAWSTTLDITPEQLHSLTTTISLPWQLWYAQATPSLELIQTSQYFRLDKDVGAVTPLGEATFLRAWWPFLFMSLLVYGLLPRLLCLLLTHSRLTAAVKFALVDTPGSQQVLLRMRDLLVETHATTHDSDVEVTPRAVETAQSVAGTKAVTVSWCSLTKNQNLEVKWLLEQFSVISVTHFFAGGHTSLTEDSDVIRQIAQTADQPVIVLVRAGESPTLETWDFVNELQAQLRSARVVYVCPLAIDEADRPSHPQVSEVRIWSAALRAHTDAILLSKVGDDE